MRTYEFKYDDRNVKAYLVRGEYANNNTLFVHMMGSEGGGWEPWANITVNLNHPLQDDRLAFIDTNNCPWAASFLIEKGLAVDTGILWQSGYCQYPLYRFTDKFFEEAE